MADELPRVSSASDHEGVLSAYNEQMLDVEIQKVSRELYKAFSGKTEGFAEVR